MTLTPGTRLGPYEIDSPIGAGGMGEVYKAKDTRLDRVVAVKVLPAHLSENKKLRQRLEQEARAVSSLNHPHICTLHDVGEENGVLYLVMEYIEGETLARRLAQGPLPLEDALTYGVQIGEGLDGAHRAGIVHRDLKPTNVMVTSSGLKILDFGLAKPYGESVETESSTKGRSLTAAGAVVGTLSYMSPEQLRGEVLDNRTDVFAYGAVLYEMVTGHPAFTRSTQAETITAILSEDPSPLSDLRPEVPARLDGIVATCLRKKSRERWASTHDVALLLQGSADHDNGATSKSPRRPTFSKSAGVILLVVLLGLVASWLGSRNDRTYLNRTTVALPPESVLAAGELRSPLAVSPQGTHVAFFAASRSGTTPQVYVHSIGEFEAQPLQGTDDAAPPVFFSPDGEWVGFSSGSTIMKVNRSGGAPIKVCDTGFMALGASWGDDGSIVVGGLTTGLMTVSAAGGELQPLIQPDVGEQYYAHPQFLRGSRTIVFDISADEATSVAVYSLDTNLKKTLFQGARPQRGSSDSLLYVLDGRIMAVDFDYDGLERTGTPVAIVEGVSGSSNVGHYAVSSTRLLVYAPLDGRINAGELTWVDRNGVTSLLGIERRAYSWPRLSPAGTQVAAAVGDTGRREIWVQDLARGSRVRLTDASDAVMPAWSPDGSTVAYGLNRSGRYQVYTAKADGSGEVRLVVEDEISSLPFSWSNNGDVAFHKIDPINKRDLWSLTPDGDEIPLVATPANEFNPLFSPDGAWVAYVSDDSGQNEVYVIDYPEREARIVVSNNGGSEPLWSRDGRELFYRRGDFMMVADVDNGSSFSVTPPRTLFAGRFARDVGGVDIGVTNYDISPDGERFLMVVPVVPPNRLHILVDWTETRLIDAAERD